MQRAPAGSAPAELAAHVAACARCQRRLLGAPAGEPPRRPLREDPPAPARVLRAGIALLAALLLALALLAGLLNLR